MYSPQLIPRLLQSQCDAPREAPEFHGEKPRNGQRRVFLPCSATLHPRAEALGKLHERFSFKRGNYVQARSGERPHN